MNKNILYKNNCSKILYIGGTKVAKEEPSAGLHTVRGLLLLLVTEQLDKEWESRVQC